MTANPTVPTEEDPSGEAMKQAEKEIREELIARGAVPNQVDIELRHGFLSSFIVSERAKNIQLQAEIERFREAVEILKLCDDLWNDMLARHDGSWSTEKFFNVGGRTSKFIRQLPLTEKEKVQFNPLDHEQSK